MQTDYRVEFIINQIEAAFQEAKPDDVPYIPKKDKAEITEAIALGLKVFDRLLPIIVRAAVTEYENQKALANGN